MRRLVGSGASESEEAAEVDEERDDGEIAEAPPEPELPAVFECRLCGKIFESRQRYPTCPECDSADVERQA